MLMHGITFAGHPVAAAIALRNIEIFEREGVLENVRALEPYLGELLEGIKSRVPIVGDVRGAGFFWALELVRDASGVALLGRGAREAAARLHRRPAARGGPDRPPGRPRRRRPAPRPAADQHPRGARGDGRQDRGRAGRRVRAVLRGVMVHTAHGYWLVGGRRRRAGARRWRATSRADVVVIGGGYTGLWTAWQLRAARRVGRRCSRPTLCGHGPSGRNGGFCETLWTHLPSLVERFGRDRAIEVCQASTESVETIGAWCEEQGVDAWFTPLRLPDGLDRARPRRRDRRDPRRGAAQPGARAQRGGRARPLRLAALPPRAVRAPTTRPSSPRGSRSACAARVREAGWTSTSARACARCTPTPAA